MIQAKAAIIYTQSPSEQATLLTKAARLPQPGCCLDIGAGDGRTFSNSLALIELGWRAVLVEPSPFAFAKLLDLHHANERVTLLNCAIGVDNRIVKFYECADPLYSTTRPDQMQKWASDARKYRSYWVPQITISTLMTQLGASADVLSIDIEGASVDVLMQCPLGSWDTKVVIVEHDGRAVEISGWARERGFEVAGLTAENVILSREG